MIFSTQSLFTHSPPQKKHFLDLSERSPLRVSASQKVTQFRVRPTSKITKIGQNDDFSAKRPNPRFSGGLLGILALVFCLIFGFLNNFGQTLTPQQEALSAFKVYSGTVGTVGFAVGGAGLAEPVAATATTLIEAEVLPASATPAIAALPKSGPIIDLVQNADGTFVVPPATTAPLTLTAGDLLAELPAATKTTPIFNFDQAYTTAATDPALTFSTAPDAAGNLVNVSLGNAAPNPGFLVPTTAGNLATTLEPAATSTTAASTEEMVPTSAQQPQANAGNPSNVPTIPPTTDQYATLIAEHSQTNPAPLTQEGAQAIVQATQPAGTTVSVAGAGPTGPDMTFTAADGTQTSVQIKAISSIKTFEDTVKDDLDLGTNSSNIVAVQMANTDAGTAARIVGKLKNNFANYNTTNKSIIVVDPSGNVVVPLQPFPQK